MEDSIKDKEITQLRPLLNFENTANPKNLFEKAGKAEICASIESMHLEKLKEIQNLITAEIQKKEKLNV